jgi:hypothetical protein
MHEKSTFFPKSLAFISPIKKLKAICDFQQTLGRLREKYKSVHAQYKIDTKS